MSDGLVQVYGDKPKISLESSSLTFYQLHVTFLKSIEPRKRERISARISILACTTTSFIETSPCFSKSNLKNRAQKQ